MTDQVMSAMCIGVENRPRAALRTGRTLPAVAVAAVVALLVAACDSSPSPSAGGSTTSASGVAFSVCMRSHGVPRWPDPVIGEGGAPLFVISTSKDGFDPYSPQIETKDNECTHVEHPNTGEPLGTTP
jgi:hypothetical protein